MSLPEPEKVLVARDVDVEPLVRATRAEIAQLSLQLRSTLHEAEELEAALAEDDASARELLRASLDELIEERRRELEQEMERETERAASLLASAQDEAASAQPPAAGSPASPRRLQVVSEPSGPVSDWAPEPLTPRPAEGSTEVEASTGAEGSTEVEGSTEDEPEETPAGAIGSPPAGAPGPHAAPVDEPILEHEVEPSAEEAAAGPDPAPGDDAPGAGQTVRPSEDPSTLAWRGDVPTDPALLRELVSAAVTAAVGAVVGAAPTSRTGWPAGNPWLYESTAAHELEPHPPSGPRPSAGRRLLHVDVVLPLVLVVIVFVVLLAWVG